MRVIQTCQVPQQLEGISTFSHGRISAAQHMSRLEHNLTSVSRTYAMKDFGMLSECDERFVQCICLCIHIEIERTVLVSSTGYIR